MDIKKHSYLLELFVIFIGLSLAFTLDRVWDNYKKSQAEENYLYGFYKDITNDHADLDTSLIGYKLNVERLKTILSIVDKNGIPTDTLFQLARIMGSQSKFVSQRVTYETLTASGGLDIISNYELRQNITKLYTKYNSIIFIEETFNDYISQNIFPFLQNNFDFLDNTLIDKNLGRNPVFKNMILFYYSIYKSKLENLTEVKTITEDVLRQLKEELDIN